MKKVVSLVLVSLIMVMVIVPMSFAGAEITEDEREARRARIHDRNIKLYTNYYEDGLSDYLETYNEHILVHQEIDKVKEEIKEINASRTDKTREEIKEFRLKLREQVSNGSITREEFISQLEDFTGITKDEAVNLNNSRKEIREKLEIINGLLKENQSQRKFIKEAIFENLFENDDIGVKNDLVKLLGLQKEHLSLDNRKLEVLSSIIE